MSGRRTLDPELFEKILSRHLLVRASIEVKKRSEQRPTGGLTYSMVTCSLHKSKAGTGLLYAHFVYDDPTGEQESMSSASYIDMWCELISDRYRGVKHLIDHWEQDHPIWFFAEPHIAFFVNSAGTINEIPMREDHILQALARFQVSLVGRAMGESGYIRPCVFELAARVGAHIRAQNRRNERERKSFVRTPAFRPQKK